MEGKRLEEPPPCERNWAELQRDVLMLIFLKVGVLDVLTSAGSVCHSWRKLAKDEPDLWRKIDMSNHEYGSDAFVLTDPTKLAIDRSKGRLEEFSVEYFGDDALLQYLCDRTNVLKKLCLISCYQLSDVAIAETARRQPLLEEIQITFGSFSEKVTEIVGKECPQLKIFKFNDKWYDVPPPDPDDDEEETDDDDALGIAKTMHQLRHLQLIGNRLTNDGLKAILVECSHLETLDIRRCYNVNMNAEMRSCCAKLKTIRLPGDSVDDYEFEADCEHYSYSDDFFPDPDYYFDDEDYDDFKYFVEYDDIFNDFDEDDEFGFMF